MTERSIQPTTITVPVGFGGKFPPYVPDPAPTLLVELASVDHAREEATLQERIAAVDSEAATLRSTAEADAARLLAEAEANAAALEERSRSEAAAIVESAETVAVEIRNAAEESVATTRADLDTRQSELDARQSELDARQSELDARQSELDARQSELDARQSELDARQSELDERTGQLDERSSTLDEREADLERREGHLEERRAAADAEVEEAAALLAAAHTEAELVLSEARTAAEEILSSARREAEEESRTLLAEARAAAENDTTVADRIEEIESVHRIEVQVLHDREVELLERIAALEARAESSSTPPAPSEPADAVVTTDDAVQGPSESERTDGDTVSIDLEADEAEVRVGSEARVAGRHASENRPGERSGSDGITTHAPLTEQLSISAFRAAPDNDRRGRRRR